jgi:anaerobic magnesium-protoporphyrin IX monomethyl ester cyclase
MKVLLVAPAFGQKPGHYYTFPLGLAYISSALKQAGHDVTCINLNHRQRPMEALVESLQTVSPDIVGTGGLSPHYPLLRNILATSKSVCPNAITLLGGGALTSEPELLLESTKADIGVIGEGEITAVELLQCLETGRGLADVEGLIYKTDNGRLCKTPPRAAIKDLDSIPWPDYDGFEVGILLDSYKTSDAYHLNFNDTPRTLDLISSRSCPYSCTFCFHPLGKIYRERSMDNFFA